MEEAKFYIGKIPVTGDLILAPMDGLTTHPFRLLTRQFGSAISYTEFIGAIDVIYGRPRLEDHLYFSDDERPVGYQIIDNDPQRILQAAQILETRHPDFIDINMGCSAKDVSGRGAGAGLLRDMQKIKSIFTLLVKNLSLPITAKIRLGWDEDHLNYPDVVKLLEDCGVAAIAVHGRTRQQAYDGAANWDAIADIKRLVHIPVIGNGDVKTLADIERMRAHTRCDAVMIGRAAISNPWIFSYRDRAEISRIELFNTMRKHLEMMLSFFGHPAGLIFFRKHLVQYLRPYPVPAEMRRTLLTCEDLHAFHGYFDSLQAQLSLLSQ